MEHLKIHGGMNMLLFAVLVIVFSSRSVHGATCSNLTSPQCEETDYTQPICDASNICGCKNGFPIRSGCSKKLNKPKVMFDDYRTSIIESKATGTLHCITDPEVTGDFTFEWKLNNKVLQGEVTRMYTISSANETSVGLYSCQVKYRASIASDESDPLNVILLNVSSSFSLNVTGVPTYAFAGSTYVVRCSGLPVGVSATFNLTGKKEVPVNNTILVEDAGNITCSFRDVTSDPVSTPTIVSDLTSVTIQVDNAVGGEFIYKTRTEVTLSCSSEPDMNTNLNNANVVYSFTDGIGSTEKAYTNQTFTPDSTGNHTIFCSASYNNSAAKNSTRISLIFMDNYITAVLNARGTELVEGSRLVLECSAGQGVTYTWSKDGKPIALQYDRIIQVDNVTNNDAGNYSCLAKKGNYVTQSNIVNISIVDDVSDPKIFRTDGEQGFYEGENYGLECRTASATAGMKYTWKKDDKTIANALAIVYNLVNVAASTAKGNYTCQITFQNATAVSETFTIVVEGAILGKPCSPLTAKTDCPKPEYSEVCKKDKLYRCECSPGYRINQKVCQKSSVLASSAIVVLLGVIFSRLM